MTFCLIGEEIIDFAGCTVVGDNGEAFVVHVEDQILTLGAEFRSCRGDMGGCLTITARPMRPISPLDE